MELKKWISFKNGLRYPEVRALVYSILREGGSMSEAQQTVMERWPHDPSRHVSLSGIGRFWIHVRHGRLTELGLHPPK